MQGVALFDRGGFRPMLTEAGRVLVAQARAVLAGAARFEAIAAATRDGVEPELALAIDPLVPTDAFIDSLHALRAAFPCLSFSFSTEGLGGAERRLRRGETYRRRDPPVPARLHAGAMTGDQRSLVKSAFASVTCPTLLRSTSSVISTSPATLSEEVDHLAWRFSRHIAEIIGETHSKGGGLRFRPHWFARGIIGKSREYMRARR